MAGRVRRPARRWSSSGSPGSTSDPPPRRARGGGTGLPGEVGPGVDTGRIARQVAVVVVNYESGPALARCVEGSMSEGPAELVVVDNGSADGSLAPAACPLPRRGGAGSGTEPRLRSGRQPGRRRHLVAVRSWCATPTSRSGPGCWPTWPRRWPPTPPARLVGPLIRDSDGERYPSARQFPGLVDAGRARPARDLRPGQPLHPRRTSRPTSDTADHGPEVGRLGVRGVLSGQAVSVRGGRRVRRGLLHVPRGRRPVLAARPGRVAVRLRPDRPR